MMWSHEHQLLPLLGVASERKGNALWIARRRVPQQEQHTSMSTNAPSHSQTPARSANHAGRTRTTRRAFSAMAELPPR